MRETTHERVHHEDFLDTFSVGNGFYLECSNGHSSFPPCQACPICDEFDISKELLSEIGTITAHTVVHVPPPRFIDEAPYIVAIADFDDGELTGHLTTDAVDTVENFAKGSVTVDGLVSTDERYVKFQLQ